MNSQNRTFSCPTTPQNNPRGGVMKTRGKVTCDLEKISYTDKRKNYPQYIFCNKRRDTKHESFQVSRCNCTCRFDFYGDFLLLFWQDLGTWRVLSLWQVLNVWSVLSLYVMCVALLARVFSLKGRENRDCKEWTSYDESIPSEECCRRSECSF